MTLARRGAHLSAALAGSLFALFFVREPLAGSPAPSGALPSGQAIYLAGEVEPRPDLIGALEATGMGGRYARGFAYVVETSDRWDWFSLALEDSDRVVVWPARHTVVLQMRSGAVCPAAAVLAFSPPPEQVPIALGSAAVELRPGELWRRPYRKLGPATVLFAAFPRALGVTVREVNAVQVGRVPGR
jgi:hypothetical protein